MAFNPNPPKAEYQATAGQTNFPFLFKIYFTTDMNVYHTPISTNVTTKLIEGVDYSVVINGDEGGTVTLILVVENNDYIVLERELSLTRYVEYQTSGDLLAGTLNADQDYQTYLVSDQESKLSQAITAPPGVPGFSGELPNPIGEAYLRWATDEKSLENDTTPPSWRTQTQLDMWSAQASKMTAESWAIQPVDEFVIVYTSNGDGTFSEATQDVYSAMHYEQKVKDAGIPIPSFPDDEGLALVAREAGNTWEDIISVPSEIGNEHKTMTTDGAANDTRWSPVITCPINITEDYAMSSGSNGLLVAPVIDAGATITVPVGSTLAIVGGTI